MAQSKKNNNYDKTSLELLLDFQTRLQGVGNSLAAEISKLISSTDPALIKTIVNNLPSAKESIKHQMWALNKLTKQIEKIRAEGFNLAEMRAFAYGSEIAKKAGSTVSKLADNRGKIFKKELTDKQISEILDYHPVDGKSISQWFSKMKEDDLSRITQAVQRASVEGMSVSKVVKAIRGTKENDYKDGVLETTKQSATLTARTVINGVASNAMLETCVKNSDVIDGIKFVATLDAKTCPFCGSYDGKIWKPEDAAQVKRPPLHPNCRCTVIPYVDMGDELEGERPAAAADFDKLAEDAYNQQAKEKGWKRRYEDLSPATRLKYYYQAQKDYTKATGKPAYNQVKGNTTFAEYFENQDAAFQKAWLGPKRYELYKAGQYEPLQLANPDTGYVATLEELKKVLEPELEPTPAPNQGPTQTQTQQQEVTPVPITTEEDSEKPQPPSPEIEDFDNLKKVSNLGGSTGAELVEDESGNKYVLKRGGSQGNDAEGHVRNEYNVNQFLRQIGIDVPDCKIIDTPDGPVLLSNYIEDGQTLSSWWSKASKEEKEEMRKNLRKGLAADIITGNWDVIGLGADNILVDKNGKPWRIDNGGALGYRAQGAKKTAEEWSDGFPDELWTMTGRGANIGNNQTNKITNYLPKVGLREIINDIEGMDFEEALKTLPQEDQDIIRKRLDNIHKLAKRGNNFVDNGYTEEYTEKILEHSYLLTKRGMLDVIPESIDEDKTSTFGGFRETKKGSQDGVPSGWETTHDKIITAAKNVNYHIANGNTDFNQDKLDECYKLKPILETEAKNGDKNAQYYLDKINEIESGIQNNKAIPVIVGPNASKVSQKNQNPFWEQMEQYVNSSPLSSNQDPSYDIIEKWASAQASDSYYPGACDYKMFELYSMGDDVTDKSKSIDEVLRMLRNKGYYVGDRSLGGDPEEHEKTIRASIQKMRDNPDYFKKGCDAQARYKAGVMLALEKTHFIGDDKDTYTAILTRTEKYNIPTKSGTIGTATEGELLEYHKGVNESYGQAGIFCFKGKELTMTRVPYCRINGFWWTYRSKYTEMFMSDREREFNANVNGLPTYLIKHNATSSHSIKSKIDEFKKIEKKNKNNLKNNRKTV